MSMAERVQRVKPSKTLAVAATAASLQAQGRDILNLSTGEPDFDTPKAIKAAAIAAIDAGATKYTAVEGMLSLREAICHKFKHENQLDYLPGQVIVSTGAKQCLYNLCQVLLNKGDEVVIPAPYWVSYPDMVLLAGGIPKIISTTPEARYKITPEQLEAAITPRTKLLFLNSPSNPSGVAYGLEEWAAFAEVLERHPHVFIATDDIYEHIQWGHPFSNILNVKQSLASRTIVINGVSKAYAMTGWRIGYAAGPQPIISAMKTIQSQSTSNACSIAQHAALAALTGDQTCIKNMVKHFEARHHYLVSTLETIPDVQVIAADGTFYLFPNVQAIIEKQGHEDDTAFAEALLQTTGIALVPGSAFGNPGCVRLSFATDLGTLEKAMDRFDTFCRQ